MQQKKNSSTYLLYGKEGSGRWMHAIAFTALLNCESVVEEDLYYMLFSRKRLSM